MKHLGWVLGGWVGAGRVSLDGSSCGPSLQLLRSGQWHLHFTCRRLSLYRTWAKGRKMEQPREARATQPEEVGVVGGPEELGLEHFLDAFYFPLKLTFITGTMTFSSCKYLKNGANWSPSHSSLFIVTTSSQACCERSHESPAQEISASFVYSIDSLSLILILSMYILPQSVASDRSTTQSRM